MIVKIQIVKFDASLQNESSIYENRTNKSTGNADKYNRIYRQAGRQASRPERVQLNPSISNPQ
jgi:hypothetical protein